MPNQVASMLLESPAINRTTAKVQSKTGKEGKDFLDVLQQTAKGGKALTLDTPKPDKPAAAAKRNAKIVKASKNSRRTKPSEADVPQPTDPPTDAEQTTLPEATGDQPVGQDISVEKQTTTDPSSDRQVAENDRLATNVTPAVPLSNLRISDIQNTEESLPAQNIQSNPSRLDQQPAVQAHPSSGTTPATPAIPARPAQVDESVTPAVPAKPAIPADSSVSHSTDENSATPVPENQALEKPQMPNHLKVPTAQKNNSPVPTQSAPQENVEAVEAKPTTSALPLQPVELPARPETPAQKLSAEVDSPSANSQASPNPGQVPSPMASVVAVSATANAHVVHAENTVSTTPTLLPVSFAEDNLPHIVTSIHTELLPKGGRMQIRLDPPELGALQVTVQMRDGQMTASFQTSNDEATRLLSHSLTQLKDSLQAQGVSVEKLHVQQMPRQQQSNTERQQQQNTPFDGESARQEQQRRQMLQRMWDRLANGRDPLDTIA